MSVVSIAIGVTLICALIEARPEDRQRFIDELNAQLKSPSGVSLVGTTDGAFVGGFEEISSRYGKRFPNHLAFAIGISHLDEDAFAAYLMARKWERPENVVLIIQPEHGPTRVWRPVTRSNHAAQDGST
jgi:hypothetical protein